MERSPIHVDEFGTIRFKVYSEQGKSYEFEHAPDSDLLFVTVRDNQGRAEVKKIVNIDHPKNYRIVETYKSYISDLEEEGNDGTEPK